MGGILKCGQVSFYMQYIMATCQTRGSNSYNRGTNWYFNRLNTTYKKEKAPMKIGAHKNQNCNTNPLWISVSFYCN